jgi:glycosyltransferase involved in cell wall biosynthesis
VRIALISDQSGPYYIGGYENRLWEFARRLARAGNEIHLFTSCPADETVEGVRLHRVVGLVNYFPPRGDQTGFRSLFRNAIYALCLGRFFFGSRLRFDIVDANSIPWLHLPFAWLLSKWWRARFIITVHEAFAAAIDSYFAAKAVPFAKLQAHCAKAFYLWSQSLADEIVAASPSCVDGIRKEGALQRITVLSPGQDIAPEDEIDFTSRELAIVTTGRLVQMKRIDVLLQAVSRLGNPIVNVIGDGPLREKLTATAERLGLTRSTFYGVVDEATKREILLRSSVFVLSSYREGWSLATLEAMAHGCLPVFASRPSRYDTGVTTYAHPGINALQFDGTIEGLVESIAYASADVFRLATMRRRAWETARRYSWPEAISTAEKLYYETASTGSKIGPSQVVAR